MSFKAARGVCTIQVKANSATDADLSVSVTVGLQGMSRKVSHNFARHQLLRLPGEWDFESAIPDPDAQMPSVALTLEVEPVVGAPRTPSPSPERHQGSCSLASMSTASSLRSPPMSPSLVPWPCPPPLTEVPAFRLGSSCDGAGTGSAAGAGPSFFSFAMRRAEGVELGLQMVPRADDQGFIVSAVVPGGAIDAWNKQCVGGNVAAARALRSGDEIRMVNGCTACDAMLKEIDEKYLVRLSVARGSPAGAPLPGPGVPGSAAAEAKEVAPQEAGGLRAEAPEWRPPASPAAAAVEEGSCAKSTTFEI